MNMKSIIKTLALAAVMTFAASAQADSYLYWMVGDAGRYADATYAKIGYTTDGGTSVTYLYNGNPGAAADADTFTNYFLDQYAKLGSTALDSSYKFFVELYESSNGTGRSELLAYTDIAGAIGSSSLAITDQAVFNFSGAVPEPTSGMLALLGFGLLALRRKQKIA